jgi:hypothetical protein
MRTELVDVIEDKARGHALRNLSLMEALPLTETQAALLDIGIRAGIKATLEIVTGVDQ